MSYKVSVCDSLRCHEIYSIFLSSGAVEEKTTFGPGRPQGNDGVIFVITLSQAKSLDGLVCQANILAAKAVSDSVWHLDVLTAQS